MTINWFYKKKKNHLKLNMFNAAIFVFTFGIHTTTHTINTNLTHFISRKNFKQWKNSIGHKYSIGLFDKKINLFDSLEYVISLDSNLCLYTFCIIYLYVLYFYSFFLSMLALCIMFIFWFYCRNKSWNCSICLINCVYFYINMG